MEKQVDKQDLFANQFPDEKTSHPHVWRWGLFAFLCVFFLTLLFVNAYLQRQFLISQIKKHISYSIDSLNQFGWDLAYDNISFHPFPLFPLGELSNVKLYNRYDKTAWNAEKIRFDNSILKTQKLNFEVSGKQFITFRGGVYKTSLKNQDLTLKISSVGKIEAFSLKLLNFSVADFADMQQIVLFVKHLPSGADNISAPSFQILLEISNLKLNGLLDYPLSQNIRKIYLKASTIGKINFSENFKSNLREWMAHSGHFEIDDFILNWSPLLLVGKGDLYLNENFKPILRLDTTSKGLSVLIEDLEHKNWLDSKGIFVAKILLASKSYKSDENDEYLTVTTPISIRDDALLIEKIAVKKFNQVR